MGAQHCPFGLHALRGVACRGDGGRPCRGGWPSTSVRGVWCQALSLPRPPVPWGGQPGFREPCFPGAVCVGGGTQHWPHSVRSCEPSLRAVGVAGGRPWGRAPRAILRGRLGLGALALPWLPVCGAGGQGALLTCCGRGCVGVGVPPVRGAGGRAWVRVVCVVPLRCLCAGECVAVRCVSWCRGAWCCIPPFVAPVPPSLALPRGVVLAVACGCAPFPARVRAHTHAEGARGLPQGQADRARGTHRPRGMAYQQARVRDIRTGQPATRSAGHAGQEGGNRRDTTPGTGPSPPKLAASAAHTRTGHYTRLGSSGALRHAPTPRLGSLRASPRGTHWRQASSTGPAAPAPRATRH